MRRLFSGALFCSLWLCSHRLGAGQPLVIDFLISSGPERTAWFKIVEQFARENPDLDVVRSEHEQEQYKQQFLTRLEKGKVDVAFWFAGERLRDAAARGLLAPLGAKFVDEVMRGSLIPATHQAATLDGKVYGFPISYYAWGFVYRKSLFAKLGITPPTTWSELLSTCTTLQQAGVAPIGLGAAEGWPAAAWFDYLDLRQNGLQFHRKLLAGAAAPGDPRVLQVFTLWKELLDRGCFQTELLGKHWDTVLPYLYRQMVGMTLMGGFAAARFPEELSHDLGFFSFPALAAAVPRYEEAPLDVLVLPAHGENPAGARRFLAFLAHGSALDDLNQVLHAVSPRLGTQRTADDFLRAEQDLLESAADLSLFFDRDAAEPLVQPSFAAFRDFLVPPHDAARAAAALGKLQGRRPLQ